MTVQPASLIISTNNVEKHLELYQPITLYKAF